MVSKLWWNLVLWGLGDRLERKSDYKSNILMVLNAMTLYSLVILSGLYGGLTYWLLSSVLLAPASWIGTQLAIGYVLVRNGRTVRLKSGPETERGATAGGPVAGSGSEEP